MVIGRKKHTENDVISEQTRAGEKTILWNDLDLLSICNFFGNHFSCIYMSFVNMNSNDKFEKQINQRKNLQKNKFRNVLIYNTIQVKNP